MLLHSKSPYSVHKQETTDQKNSEYGCFLRSEFCHHGESSQFICSHIYNVNIALLWVNLFLTKIPILYPLKTLEYFWFSGVFRGYKVTKLSLHGLMAGWFCVLEKQLHSRDKTTKLGRYISWLFYFFQKHSPTGALKNICFQIFNVISRIDP